MTGSTTYTAPDGSVVAKTDDRMCESIKVSHPKLGTIIVARSVLKLAMPEPKGGAVKVGKFIALRVGDTDPRRWRLDSWSDTLGNNIVTWEQLCELGTPVPLIDPTEPVDSVVQVQADPLQGGSLLVEPSVWAGGAAFLRIGSSGGRHLDKGDARRAGLALLAMSV